MTKAGRKATAALVAALTLTVAGRASADDRLSAAAGEREATVVLHVANYAGMSRDVLDDAGARVASVYAAIGVRTVWMDAEETTDLHDGRLHLTILLLSRDMAEKKISAERIGDGVLGQAHLPSARAHIFCDRIAASRARTIFLVAIGDVIAHEVGHLLLRTTNHSRGGIMRANVDVRPVHIPFQSFDTAQAGTIRTALMDMTTPRTAR